MRVNLISHLRLNDEDHKINKQGIGVYKYTYKNKADTILEKRILIFYK